MGTVTRFPQERVDYFRSTDYSRSAIVLILPVVKRDDPFCNDETFAAMKASFKELHAALADPTRPMVDRILGVIKGWDDVP